MATNDAPSHDPDVGLPAWTRWQLDRQYELVQELAQVQAAGSEGCRSDGEDHGRLLEEFRELATATRRTCADLEREELEVLLREIAD